MEAPPPTRLFDDLPCDDVVALTAGPIRIDRAEVLCMELQARGIAFHTDLPWTGIGFQRLSLRILSMGRGWRRMPVSVYICRDDLPAARPIALTYLEAELVARER